MFKTILEWIKALFFSGTDSSQVNVQVTVNNVEPAKESTVATTAPTPAETIVAAVEDVKPKRKPRKKKVTPPTE